jgi:hypothetical protein
MNILWGVLLIVILVVFVFVISSLPGKPKVPYDDEARQLITQFTKSGEYIGFDVDPLPPVTKYVYDVNQQITGIVSANGTVTPVTEEEAKELSLLTLDVQDRELSQSKICKKGYQCDITGKIVLVDPETGDKLPPPHKYSLTIDCDYRDFCALSPSLSIKPTLSFNDGTFKYTFVVTEKIPTGEYHVTVFVTSFYTSNDGEQERRMAVRTLEVVE